MRLLVTGRNGQLARSLAERAIGHELVFADRPGFDLLDPNSIERTIAAVRPDVVISAAAYTAVDAAEDEPVVAMAANGVAPGVIARAARRADARLVHVSTDYVFDGTQAHPYQESDPPAPLGVYGCTKRAGEEAVIAAGGDGAVLRTAWVYGPFGQNFVRTMLRLAQDRDEVAVVADQRGSPTASLDLAETIVRLIDFWRGDARARGIVTYHAAGRGDASWADVARTVFAERALLGWPPVAVREITTADYPTRARRPAYSVLDSSRLAALLGWQTLDWRQGVAQTTRRSLAAD